MINLTPNEIKYISSQDDKSVLFTFANSTYLAQLTEDGKAVKFFRRAPKSGNFNLVKNETKEKEIAKYFKALIKDCINEKNKHSNHSKNHVPSDLPKKFDDEDGDGIPDEDQISSSLQRLFDSEWLLPMKLIMLIIRIFLLISCCVAYIFLVIIKYTLLPLIYLLHQFAYLVSSVYIIILFIVGNQNPDILSTWYYRLAWFIGVIMLLLPTIARFLPDLIKMLSNFIKTELLINNKYNNRYRYK